MRTDPVSRPPRVTILGENHADPACKPAREAAFARGLSGDEFVAMENLKHGDPDNPVMLRNIFPSYSEEASRFRGMESVYPELLSATFIVLHALHGAIPGGEHPKYRAEVLQRILSPEGQRAWSQLPRPIGHPALEQAALAIDSLAQRDAPLTFDGAFYAVAGMPVPVAACVTRLFAAAVLTDIQAQLEEGGAPAELMALEEEGRLESLAESLASPADYDAYGKTVERITFRYREVSMTSNLMRIVEEAAQEGKDVTVVTGQAHLEAFSSALLGEGVEVIERPYEPGR